MGTFSSCLRQQNGLFLMRHSYMFYPCLQQQNCELEAKNDLLFTLGKSFWWLNLTRLQPQLSQHETAAHSREKHVGIVAVVCTKAVFLLAWLHFNWLWARGSVYIHSNVSKIEKADLMVLLVSLSVHPSINW